MALFVQQGVITAPTVDGTDTVLSGLTTPKAIILWSTGQTATGTTTEGAFCWGAFTYDGSAVQQFYNGYHSKDAAPTSSDVAIGGGVTSCLKNFLVTRAANATTNDYELRGVSMDSSSITLDWFAAPSAAIKVHYMVLGGDDLSAARIGSYVDDAVTTPQDVTINAGWGQPDLVLFGGRIDGNTTVSRDVATSGGFYVGAGIKDGTQRGATFRETDAQTNNVLVQAQAAWATREHSTTEFETGVLEAPSSGWPTDGFAITKTIGTGRSDVVFYLALKGSFKKTLSSTTTLTSGGPQNLAANFSGTTIRGALLWGWNLGTLAGLRSTDADLGMLFMGGTDGTTEGSAAIIVDDGAARLTDRVHSETKALIEWTPGATPTQQAEADASFSGDNVSLSYSDLDSVTREYNYLILGDAVSAASSRPLQSRRPRNIRPSTSQVRYT